MAEPKKLPAAPIPQVIITLSPLNHMQAEIPGINGARRIVPITTLDDIYRILHAQSITATASSTVAPRGIGHHLKHHKSEPDTLCPWCVADELGIEYQAFQPRPEHQPSRRRSSSHHISSHHIGDGSVRVTYLQPKSRHLKPQSKRFDFSDFDLNSMDESLTFDPDESEQESEDNSEAEDQ